jgi:hypothetical protein
MRCATIEFPESNNRPAVREIRGATLEFPGYNSHPAIRDIRNATIEFPESNSRPAIRDIRGATIDFLNPIVAQLLEICEVRQLSSRNDRSVSQVLM